MSPAPRAAQALADYLATDPTGSGDPDFLIIGDLNSYRDGGPDHDTRGGGLHRPASSGSSARTATASCSTASSATSTTRRHASAGAQSPDAGEWHINADEPAAVRLQRRRHDAGEAAFERESTALPLYEAATCRIQRPRPGDRRRPLPRSLTKVGDRPARDVGGDDHPAGRQERPGRQAARCADGDRAG